MPLDGLTLCHLTRELNQALANGRIDKIIQPEQDEVQLFVYANGRNVVLLLSASAGCARAHLTSVKKRNPLEPFMLNMLMRKHLVGGRILSVRQLHADRVMEITVEHRDELGERAEKRIVCEFMGRHSNIIFIDGKNTIIDSARRVTDRMSSVREVLPGLPYEDPPAHGRLDFDKLDADNLRAAMYGRTGTVAKFIQSTVSGLSRQTAQELAQRAAGDADSLIENAAPDFPERFCGAMGEMLAHTRPEILRNPDGAPLDVTAVPYRIYDALEKEVESDLSAAMDRFYQARDAAERISQKSASLHRTLKQNIERCEKKLALQNEALAGGEKMDEYRLYGELLTANLHLIKKGAKSAQVPDYYAEGMPMREIPLDEKLSPGRNAERYYKLYRKARSARLLAAEQAEKTREELEYLEGQMENLRKCDTESELFEIRQELEKLGYVRATTNRRQMKQLPPSEPLKFTAPDGTIVLVGKNNLQNDKLTGTAQALETWLHAKDIPGSHVIIVGTDVSDETLLFAARLAARYSSASASSKVAVDYTLKKYVKKPAGAKPGRVIYTNQRTLFVEPAEV